MMRKTNKNWKRKFQLKPNHIGVKFFVFLFLSSMSMTSFAQTVSGTITDADGLELIGATILQKGTANGTVTDLEGNYSLTLTEGEKVLVFSYTGYESIEESARAYFSMIVLAGAKSSPELRRLIYMMRLLKVS